MARKLKEPKQDNHFLVVWDMTGLECCIDLNAKEKECLLDMIATNSNSYGKWLRQTMQMLTMRANANSQRNYEIYSVYTDPSIDEKMIVSIFEDCPQTIVDLIRERGINVYGAKRGHATQVIF